MFALTFGPFQIAFLLLLGVLLFGHRLPEVSRSLAKALREFRNALHGIEDEVAGALHHSEPPVAGRRAPQRDSAVLPRIESSDAGPSA
jgi:sec-independent protein translocase protein TatA